METKEEYAYRWQQHKIVLLGIINKYLPGAKVYLYGSRARGDFQAGSDIDLAIDAGKKINHELLLKMYGDIEETNLPTLFDVVDIYSISPEMLVNIKKDWIPWN